jgi:hypothetical protein
MPKYEAAAITICRLNERGCSPPGHLPHFRDMIVGTHHHERLSLSAKRRRLDGTNKTLFTPIVRAKKRSPRFEHLRTAPTSEAARMMLDDVFQNFSDPDGNFLEQFQTTGFDARFFELYLYAYFSRSGYQVDRSHENPDFLVARQGTVVAVEATTVNASTGGAVAKFGTKIADLTEEERREYLADELPIRFGSALFSKLKQHYWDLPHCIGLPFVIAIEAFHDPGSLDFSDTSLASYLYGLRHSASWTKDGELVVHSEDIKIHRLGEKTIPSGFFNQPGAELVSAVLFTNSGTSAKFTRMGYQSGYGNDSLKIRRIGRAYNPDPDAMDSTLFSYDLDDPPIVETWGQGLVVLHNPNSLHPVPDGFFDSVIYGKVVNGNYVPYSEGWHPFQSRTFINHLGELKKKLPPMLIGCGPQAVGAIDRNTFHDLCPELPRQMIGEEDGWFADQSDAFLGLVLKENERNWTYLVFARNHHFIFRAIAQNSGYRMRVLACEAVQIQIMEHLHKPQRIFPNL